ncbi:hypothetical protein PtrSN002B_011884, partial [Pyrenophora tritici-repentis]
MFEAGRVPEAWRRAGVDSQDTFTEWVSKQEPAAQFGHFAGSEGEVQFVRDHVDVFSRNDVDVVCKLVAVASDVEWSLVKATAPSSGSGLGGKTSRVLVWFTNVPCYPLEGLLCADALEIIAAAAARCEREWKDKYLMEQFDVSW